MRLVEGLQQHGAGPRWTSVSFSAQRVSARSAAVLRASVCPASPLQVRAGARRRFHTLVDDACS